MTMADAAFHGLAGDVCRALEPYSEADPAGLLLTTLVAFGAAVGPGPHAMAGGSEHPARLFACLVGRSSRARKGTALASVRGVFDLAVAGFRDRCIGGIGSGEGLVANIARRDEGERSVLVVESELGRLLRTASRSASLSALVRQAWDGDDLAVVTRSKPLRAAAASVSLLGHCTSEEVRLRLSSQDVANGFGNRILWCWVERSKRLATSPPVPENLADVLAMRVMMGLDGARRIGRLTWSPAAAALWSAWYDGIDDDVVGVVGALTSRAEAQVLRLAVTYSLMDVSSVIDRQHLEAALAVWGWCEATVNRVWGTGQQPTLGEADPVVARLLAALAVSPDGLDGTAQRDLFQRHESGETLARARAELAARGLAVTVIDEGGVGRPRIITRLVANTDQVRSQVAKSQPVVSPTPATCDLATEVGGSEPPPPPPTTPPVPDTTDGRKRARWLS
jgi:hypothetical protein